MRAPKIDVAHNDAAVEVVRDGSGQWATFTAKYHDTVTIKAGEKQCAIDCGAWPILPKQRGDLKVEMYFNGIDAALIERERIASEEV